ncbi:hypothetical protein FCV25MIE_35053, partial [Fagus crenata]
VLLEERLPARPAIPTLPEAEAVPIQEGILPERVEQPPLEMAMGEPYEPRQARPMGEPFGLLNGKDFARPFQNNGPFNPVVQPQPPYLPAREFENNMNPQWPYEDYDGFGYDQDLDHGAVSLSYLLAVCDGEPMEIPGVGPRNLRKLVEKGIGGVAEQKQL